MTTITEYQAHRAAVTQIDIKAIPEVRPFARRHVAALEAEGQGGLVLRQLVREAQSVRRTNDDASLLENAHGLNVPAIQEGFDALCHSLANARTSKESKLQHVGGKFNPVNNLSVEEQAGAVWGGFCSLLGALANQGDTGLISVQSLAKAIAGRLRALTSGAAPYKELGYERAALVLIDYMCESTGWLVEMTGERSMLSEKQNPNSIALTPKFLNVVLGDQGVLVDLAERKPMLVPPVPWTTTATHGGYLHNGIPAVRGTRWPIESPVIVSALNALQATPFRVNSRVLAVARSFGINAETLPDTLIAGEFIEERHDEHADLQRSKTIRSALTIGAFSELETAEAFYFPWNLDWRGRMYPATSLIGPQGADLTKACLEFADGTCMGRDGGEWLAILLCNLAGADKQIVDTGNGLAYQTRTPKERIEWTREHSDLIQAVAADPIKVRDWHFSGGFGREKIKQGKRKGATIDSPWQFLAACFEWADYLAEGPGFRSRLSGALDGSCSGVQMLSGMTRDESAGAMVNLVPAPRGDDYYGRMARALTARLCGKVKTADNDTMQHLQYWSTQTIDRDLLKGPSMTKVYSAGTYTFATQVQAKTGASEQQSMWLAGQINACFADVAPGMLRAMNYLQEVADVLTEQGIPLVWRTPAGLRVEQSRTNTDTHRIKTKPFGIERKRTFYVDTDELSKTKQRAGVSPNFVHGVDASHMAMTVNALHAQGVRNFWMVHDSFGAPLAQCGMVFETTRESFIALMSEDLLQKWTEDVTARLPESVRELLPALPVYGDLNLEAVRESVYAWY